MTYQQELDVALAAARLAGVYILEEYANFVPIPNAPATISTHVDHQSQEIILQYLHKAFPQDRLVAEEATPTLNLSPGQADRVWVVDPIDGTRGFAMKNGEFSVMIGLTVGNQVVVGVVLEPVLNRVTYASLGAGCWVQTGEEQPQRCHVTERVELVGGSLVQSRSKPGSPPKIGEVKLKPGKVLETYSAGIKLAMVARGDVETYVNDYRNFHDWDVCAGQVLVEEAGGKVTLLDGGPIIYGGKKAKQRDGLLATNGKVHGEAVQKVKRGIVIVDVDVGP
jgi:3'(2'), 5'-bisphosphate nucleotidase